MRMGVKKMKNNIEKFLLMTMVLLIGNIIGANKFINYYENKYTTIVEELEKENLSLTQALKEYTEVGIPVKVTMYQPVPDQTDSTPNILADGTRIRTQEASNYKYIAVSRNLLKRWGGFLDFGDWVLLRGTDLKDGVYQVRDVMNKRFVNRIDILEGIDINPYMFPEAEIVKLSWASVSAGE